MITNSCPSAAYRGSTRRGPASVRRPSRLVKSKPERRRAACIARLICRQAVRRAAVATRALAAQVNLYPVRSTNVLRSHASTRPGFARTLRLPNRPATYQEDSHIRFLLAPQGSRWEARFAHTASLFRWESMKPGTEQQSAPGLAKNSSLLRFAGKASAQGRVQRRSCSQRRLPSSGTFE